MQYILVILLLGNPTPTGTHGTSSIVAEFNSLDACEFAMDTILDPVRDARGGNYAIALTCAPKGIEQTNPK